MCPPDIAVSLSVPCLRAKDFRFGAGQSLGAVANGFARRISPAEISGTKFNAVLLPSGSVRVIFIRCRLFCGLALAQSMHGNYGVAKKVVLHFR